MVFKKKYNFLLWVLIFFFTVIISTKCSNSKKAKIDIFYIELVNFNNDSLKKQVSENIFDKVSFYQNSKLVILSSNYVTENFPDIHSFKNAETLDKNIEPGTKKIKVEFGGNYTVDSIRYSLQKYIYSENKWIKKSDMGFIKGTTTYKKAKEYAIMEFGKQIVNNIVAYTYN